MTESDKGSADFDPQAAHAHFSTHCFNSAWDLIDLSERTPEEDHQMLSLAMASHWHWTQRPDYDGVKASVGYWQIARVYALLGQADNARACARRSLEALEGEGARPFFEAYAYEALARAEAVAGDTEAAAEWLERARELAARVSDEESRRMLLDDLDTIGVASDRSAGGGG